MACIVMPITLLRVRFDRPNRTLRSITPIGRSETDRIELSETDRTPTATISDRSAQWALRVDTERGLSEQNSDSCAVSLGG